MDHLKKLTEQELTAVRKFQEYGASVKITTGYSISDAYWKDLVHTGNRPYTDQQIRDKASVFYSKIEKNLSLAKNEVFSEETTNVEFGVQDGIGETIEFTTEDCYYFLSAAFKARKELLATKLTAKKKASIEKEIAKLEAELETPADRLAKLKTMLNTMNSINAIETDKTAQ